MESTRYRPFNNHKECEAEMLKHPSVEYLLIGANRIIHFSTSSTGIYSDKFHTYYDALYRYKFTDGTPFGIKVKEKEND